MYQNLIVRMIELIHLLISIFIGIGGYIIPIKYIPIYLLSLPYIVIDWNDKDRYCWLTKVINIIKPESNKINGFLYELSQKYDINMKENDFRFILYIILITNWSYAYYRLINQYKIKIFQNDLIKYILYFLILSWCFIYIFFK